MREKMFLPYYIRCIHLEFDGVMRISEGDVERFVKRFIDIYNSSYKGKDILIINTIVGPLRLHPACKNSINSIKWHLHVLSSSGKPTKEHYTNLVMAVMDYNMSEEGID